MIEGFKKLLALERYAEFKFNNHILNIYNFAN